MTKKKKKNQSPTIMNFSLATKIRNTRKTSLSHAVATQKFTTDEIKSPKRTAMMSQRSRGACSALRMSRMSEASRGSWSRATLTSSSEFCTGMYTDAIDFPKALQINCGVRNPNERSYWVCDRRNTLTWENRAGNKLLFVLCLSTLRSSLFLLGMWPNDELQSYIFKLRNFFAGLRLFYVIKNYNKYIFFKIIYYNLLFIIYYLLSIISYILFVIIYYNIKKLY